MSAPVVIYWWACPACELSSLRALDSAMVAYLAGLHDLVHHGTRRTAELKTNTDTAAAA
jgi:hypothetical protein